MKDPTQAADPCQRTIALVERALWRDDLSLIPTDTYQHLAGCSRCRSAMQLLIRGLDPNLPAAVSTTCEDCRVDLPAFIDAEQADPALAAQRFPRVWWHLWSCAACTEIHALTWELIEAEKRGDLPPIP